MTDINNLLPGMCWANMNQELCISLDIIQYITDENLNIVVVHVLTELSKLLQKLPQIVINIYMVNEFPLSKMKYVGIFFDIFKNKIPSQHLQKLYIHTKKCYKGVAKIIVYMAEKKIRDLIEIKSI